MRTSLCSSHAYSPFQVDWQAAAGNALRVEDSLGPAANVHGPGPCLSYPDVLQVRKHACESSWVRSMSSSPPPSPSLLPQTC